MLSDKQKTNHVIVITDENIKQTSKCYFCYSINQHKLVGALRHALKVLDEGQYGGRLLMSVDANGMVTFVAKAVRKSTLSNSAKKQKLEQVGKTIFEWVILIKKEIWL